MRLRVTRLKSLPTCTIGKMYIDYQNGQGWQYFCDTLEDVEREVKVMHETCIPKGVYRCINTLSQRFGKIMPLLTNVKNYTGIRIHAGNTDKDTSGCILVGTEYKGKLIYYCL
jgi:hypothetical protein